MTIIVTKTRIIIDVVGSYFYDKKTIIENGLFLLGGLETHPHDILWAVHDVKIMVEVRARKFSGSSRLRLVVGAERCGVVCAFLSYARVCARHSLTEPERGVRLLNPSDRTSYVLKPIDPFAAN